MTGQLIWILFCHWVADFVLQSDRIAKEKSKNDTILLAHFAQYTMAMTLLSGGHVVFAGVNGVAHLLIDYFTSRASSRLWKAGKTHWFFVVIGFDQLLHTSLLIATWEILK